MSFAVLMLKWLSNTMHHERPPGPKPSVAPEHPLKIRLQTSGYWRSIDPPWKTTQEDRLIVLQNATESHSG